MIRNNRIIDNVFIDLLLLYLLIIYSERNRVGGVMVSVLASSAVDHGFEPRSGQTYNHSLTNDSEINARLLCII